MLIAGLKRMVLKQLSCLSENFTSAKNKTGHTFGWMSRIQHIWRGLRGVQFLVHSGLLQNQSSRAELLPHQRVGSLEGRQVRVEAGSGGGRGAVSRSSSKIQRSFIFRKQNNNTCCFHLSTWRSKGRHYFLVVVARHPDAKQEESIRIWRRGCMFIRKYCEFELKECRPLTPATYRWLTSQRKSLQGREK